jgi:hypothetical protein
MSYNPNVNIPPYHGDLMENNFKNNYSNNDLYLPQINSRENMNTLNTLNTERMSQMPMQNMQQMANMQNMQQMPMQNMPMQNMPMQQMPMQQMHMQNMGTSNQYKKSKIDTFDTTTTKKKFDWLLFGKRVAIYTILFLIISHVKMNELVCRFIPFLNDNELLCMTTKGLILAIIIVIIQQIL